MAGQNWQVVKRLLGDVLEQAPAERAAYLAAQNISADLAAEVWSLLAMEEESLLRRPVAAVGAALETRLCPGDMLGSYRIVRLLGEGGMGRVYLAQQEHPVRRLVALKIAKHTQASPHARALFGQEQRALAALSHSCIAQAYDFGVTAEGVPYFVMEYVVGSTLPAFLAAYRPNEAQCLQILSKICDAVAHAHGREVVHRDLSPRNILVTFEDGRPHPKIIDFGLAQLGPTEALSGKRAGTRPFMSPEQAGLSAHPVDARTDIYALGMILAHVAAHLAGGSWWEGAALAKEPVRCSHGPLGRRRRPLAAVIRRATAADPARRYPQVTALRDDLQSLMMGRRPAGAAGWGDHLAAVLCRDAGRMTAAAALVLLLVSPVVWGLRRPKAVGFTPREPARVIAQEPMPTVERAAVDNPLNPREVFNLDGLLPTSGKGP